MIAASPPIALTKRRSTSATVGRGACRALQAASASKEAATQYGSFGIGKGGLDAKAALFWLLVGIPLAWGVYKTLLSAAKIF